MAIVLYLGKDVKDYEKRGKEIIAQRIRAGEIRCELCAQPMKQHSSYERGIKESGQKIQIQIVWCKKCKQGHALLPDFLLPNKHYSGNEIESVLIDSQGWGKEGWGKEESAVNEIETEASESTVRRWIKQIGERIKRAVSLLKYIFMHILQKTLSELTISENATGYAELEEILEKAPVTVEYSGNKLGLANIFLGINGRSAYI